MTFKKKTTITRIIYVSKCNKCGDRVEHMENIAKARFCLMCEQWVPFMEVSYEGPDLFGE